MSEVGCELRGRDEPSSVGLEEFNVVDDRPA